jgi:hypothetical protein
MLINRLSWYALTPLTVIGVKHHAQLAKMAFCVHRALTLQLAFLLVAQKVATVKLESNTYAWMDTLA